MCFSFFYITDVIDWLIDTKVLLNMLLFNNLQRANNRGYMTKEQLLRDAQPLSDKSFTLVSTCMFNPKVSFELEMLMQPIHLLNLKKSGFLWKMGRSAWRSF